MPRSRHYLFGNHFIERSTDSKFKKNVNRSNTSLSFAEISPTARQRLQELKERAALKAKQNVVEEMNDDAVGGKSIKRPLLVIKDEVTTPKADDKKPYVPLSKRNKVENRENDSAGSSTTTAVSYAAVANAANSSTKKIPYTTNGKWNLLGISRLFYNFDEGVPLSKEERDKNAQTLKKNKRKINEDEWFDLASTYADNDPKLEMICAGLGSLIHMYNERTTSPTDGPENSFFESLQFDFDIEAAGTGENTGTTPSGLEIRVSKVVQGATIERCAASTVNTIVRLVTLDILKFIEKKDVYLVTYTASSLKKRCRFVPLGDSVPSAIEAFIKKGCKLDSSTVRTEKGKLVRISLLVKNTIDNFIQKRRRDCESNAEGSVDALLKDFREMFGDSASSDEEEESEYEEEEQVKKETEQVDELAHDGELFDELAEGGEDL